jgi:hypothetical protein
LIYIVWKQNVARRLLNLLPSVVTLLVQIVSSCRFLNREIMGNLWKSTITVSMSFLLWGVCPRRGWWADVSRLQGPQIEALRHCVSLRTCADNRTLQDGTFQDHVCNTAVKVQKSTEAFCIICIHKVS